MRDLFTYFGGHHAAVGLTMPSENVTILQEKMNQYIVDRQIDLTRGPELRIDEVLLPNEVTVERIDELKLLAPFGTDNPLPQFYFGKSKQRMSKNRSKPTASEICPFR